LAHKAQSLRRGLLYGLVGVVALVLLGIGAATIGVLAANSGLQNEQSKTSGLLLEQARYSPVVKVQDQVNDITAVEPLAAHGEILWRPYIADLQQTLPAGTAITAFIAQLDTTAEQGMSSVPLQGARVATISITADSPKASISDWLDNLAKLKGFVDATPGSVTLVPGSGRYTVSVALHINSEALSNRFVTEKK
jgi:Tfp pilus assembly protein PilN